MIGIDFDNTVVCYDQVFHEAAAQRGWIPADLPATKYNVRDYMRRHGNEDGWTELQGYVYGPYMQNAPPFPGVLEFLTGCRRWRVPVRIISHKTLYPFQGPRYDLHKAALEWLGARGFYDPQEAGLVAEQVSFEPTKEEKLHRIGAAGCTHFIDDLPEFLSEPGFPDGVERILFDPNDRHSAEHRFQRATSWTEISSILNRERAGPP